MRVFAAVVPPAEVVDHLDTFLEPRRAAADFRWTRPEHLHVTLAFMADAEPRRVDAYADRLAETLDGLPPDALALSGAVVFPNVSQARVLATGVSGAEVLTPRPSGPATPRWRAGSRSTASGSPRTPRSRAPVAASWR